MTQLWVDGHVAEASGVWWPHGWLRTTNTTPWFLRPLNRESYVISALKQPGSKGVCTLQLLQFLKEQVCYRGAGSAQQVYTYARMQHQSRYCCLLAVEVAEAHSCCASDLAADLALSTIRYAPWNTAA